jgi:hypothetical protein
VGKHRKGQKRRHHRRRVSRRIALVSAGLLVPLTGGAVVFAATGEPGRPLAGRSQPAPAARVRSATEGRSRPAQRAPSATPLPHTPTPSTRPSPPAGPRIAFAPYADVSSWPPPSLPKEVKDYTMGFVSAGGGCSATWDGLTPVDGTSLTRRVKDVPGRAIVSFGGPHGAELAQTCGNVDDLVKEYRKAVDAADPAGLDFYLTEGALSDAVSMQRRTAALARLSRDLPLSITLPLHRGGLSPTALAALRSAAAAGVPVSIVNLVPADGADQSVTASAGAAHAQLQRLYRLGDAQTWQRMGLTPIIGVAGVGEQFGPADARQVVAWAAAHGLGRLSMWSVTRDTPCTADTNVTSDTCSGLDEGSGVFAKIFEGF